MKDKFAFIPFTLKEATISINTYQLMLVNCYCKTLYNISINAADNELDIEKNIHLPLFKKELQPKKFIKILIVVKDQETIPPSMTIHYKEKCIFRRNKFKEKVDIVNLPGINYRMKQLDKFY